MRNKKGSFAGASWFGAYSSSRLLWHDVGRARAFLALADIVCHLASFIKCGIAVGLDFREMDEQVLATVIRRDESISLCVIEPFYRTSTHVVLLAAHLGQNQNISRLSDAADVSERW